MVKNALYSLIYFLLWMITTSATIAMEGIPDDPEQPFIQVELESTETYVQSMVRYTVRLYRQSHLQRGYFMDLNSPDAVMELSQETGPKQITISDREYELLERHYLIFPQHSGTIELPAPVFSSQNLFVKGESLKLKVKPRADESTGHWLPARELEIIESFPLPDEISTGMQLKRMITIKAAGLTGPQLPTLKAPVIDGIEIQDISSKVDQSIIDEMMHGSRTIQQLFIPNRGGEFTIPEIKIDWWNTQTDSQQVTILERRTLNVNDAPATDDKPIAQEPGVVIQQDNSEPEKETEPDTVLTKNLYLIAILLSLLVYCLLIWHYRVIKRLKRHLQLANHISSFKKACNENNPHDATNALLSWGRIVFGKQSPVSIIGYRKHFKDTDAQSVLIELDRAKYSDQINGWSGNEAIKVILPLIKSNKSNKVAKKDTSLPMLYN